MGPRHPIERVVDLFLTGPRCALVAAARTGRAIESVLRQVGGVVEPEPDDPVTVLAAAAPPTPEPSRSVEHAELPIEDYDQLAARQIVDRLPGLTAADLALVEDYELANRHRRTVLGKIEQLQG